MKDSIRAIATWLSGATDSSPSPPSRLTPAQRWFSLAELALGSAIVIGYNVYHVLFNEVPILFVLGLVSLRLRDGGWAPWACVGPSRGSEPSCSRSRRPPQEFCSVSL